ncbi:MAG: hypothetical protein H6613_14185 [Ignavibacteriales bacterium]|nr:hypothetical protein [Ignavibacteriales bacterium]
MGKANRNKLSIIFNRENNTSINIDENFNNGSFSDSNSFLGFTNKTAFYFDLKNNKVLWKESLTDSEIYLDGISENTNAVLVKANVPNLTNGQWIYSNAKIISKDYFNVEKEIKEINSEVSKVSISKNNNKIFLNVDENKIELEVEK